MRTQGEIEAAICDGGTTTERLGRLFWDVPVAEALYLGSLGRVAKLLKELARVCDFLGRRGIAWRARTEGGARHRSEEVRGFLAEAERRFEDCPEILQHALAT